MVFPIFNVKTVTFVFSVLITVVYFIELIVWAANKSYPWQCTLYWCQAKYSYSVKHGQVQRLVLPILLHGSIWHLLMNLLSLLMIGFTVEKYLESKFKYAMLILIGGIGGNLFSDVANPYTVSVGASGAIYAIAGRWAFHLV